MHLDILIRIRDQLAGLVRTQTGMRDLRAEVDRFNAGSEKTGGAMRALSARLFSIGAAIALVRTGVRDFYREIEETGRLDAAAQGALKLADNVGLLRAVFREFTGAALGFTGEVSEFGVGILPGSTAAREAMQQAAASTRDAEQALHDIGTRGKKRLKELADEAARLREEQQRAAQAARDLEAALLGMADAFGAEDLVGESEGSRAVRLREEARELDSIAASMAGTASAARVMADAARLRAEAARIEQAQVERINAAAAQREEMETRKLAAAQRLEIVSSEILVLEAALAQMTRADAIGTQEKADTLERINVLLAEQEGIQREIDDAKKRAEEERRRFIAAGPGRNDFTGQVNAAIERLPTLAETAAQGVQTVYGGVFNSISAGLDGLWNRTMSLGDGLLAIAGGFGRAMLQAIADMVASYAAGKAAMFAKDVLFSQKGLLLSAATAAKSLVAWIPSAIAAGISSFGTAAAIGTAAVVAALAAAGGFEDGGFTGGREGAPAGIVHGQEFVFSAPAVRSIGAGNLASLHAAALSPAAPAGATGGTGGAAAPQDVSIAIVDRKTSAEDFLESSRGRKMLYDRVREVMREVG